MYILNQTQILPVPIETLWKFVQNPKNLDSITPPDLKFLIVNEVPEIMFDGLIIEYHITVPLFGKQQWVTEIKHIEENRSFVDEQRLGPYRFWYHYHLLTQVESGTKMLDQVYYQLPYGPLGKVLRFLMIKKTLTRIFDYRKETLASMFDRQ